MKTLTKNGNIHTGATAYCGNCNKFNYKNEKRCWNCNCLLPKDLEELEPYLSGIQSEKCPVCGNNKNAKLICSDVFHVKQ